MEEAVKILKEFLHKSANDVGLNEDWISPIVDLLKGVAMEPNNLHKFLKIKCLATSDSASSLFKGLVFTKEPVHENMPKFLGKIDLLLWKGALNMEEEDKDAVGQTYSLLEKSRANMVMVEKSISEEYQGYFLARNITAFEDMEKRLERFPKIGYSCTSFRCEKISENLNYPVKEKPLMYLEGCDSLTILLRGWSTAELKLMKGTLKKGYNHFRNKLLSSDYFLVALPSLKNLPWELDGSENEAVTVREEEVSSYIAYCLQQVDDEASESRTKYSVFCQHRDSFLELRSNCNWTEPQYISSLSRCDTWEAKGGKSGALFAKTRDTRLIIKEINHAEFDSFEKFGALYFEYMKEAKKKTSLAKIFGIYKVTLGRPRLLMVMENLSFNRNISMLYGLLYGRLTPEDSAQVRVDQNFVKDMSRSRLHINPYSKPDLQAAIRNDTEFLSGINVMDYSLLVGVDLENHEILCGIIDSFKKKVETLGKSLLLLGKDTQPTVIRPIEYRRRFLDFMDKQFLGEVDLRERVKELEQQLRQERDARLDAEKSLAEFNKKLMRSRSI